MASTSEVVEFDREDNKKLVELTGAIDDWGKRYTDSRFYRIYKKFTGDIGEALVINELFKNCTSVDKIEWAGGRKVGHDLLVYPGKIKVQVKTARSKNGFRLLSIPIPIEYRDTLKAAFEAYEGDKNGSFSLSPDIKKIFEERADATDADYWVLVNLENSSNPEYYILDKLELKEFVCDDYKNYIRETKHYKSFKETLGISESNTIEIIPTAKSSLKRLDSYKDKWNKIDR